MYAITIRCTCFNCVAVNIIVGACANTHAISRTFNSVRKYTDVTGIAHKNTISTAPNAIIINRAVIDICNKINCSTVVELNTIII